MTDASESLLGAAAPDFARRDQDGNLVRLSDYRDKARVLLYFIRAFN